LLGTRAAGKPHVLQPQSHRLSTNSVSRAATFARDYPRGFTLGGQHRERTMSDPLIAAERYRKDAEIVDKLHREINAGLADPKLKARFGELGATVLPGTPAEFGKLIADETEKWAKVIRGPRPA
jgi:Tripartite tricarboxylate transporter family receptor